MPYATVGELRLWYEYTGPEDGPLIMQFGGSLFGRQNSRTHRGHAVITAEVGGA